MSDYRTGEGRLKLPDCPVCEMEKRPIPLKVFRDGVCRTHYRHLRDREADAEWDGQPIRDARKFHVWPLKNEPYGHQLDWLGIYMEEPWVELLAPCDHGKTRGAVVSYAAFRIAENPDIRIAVIGATADLARITLGSVMSHLENNRDYIRYFKKIHGFIPKPENAKTWNKGALCINRYTTDDETKDPTLIAIGKGGELENRRIDLILCDDMVTQRKAQSQTEREADHKWFLDVIMTRGEEDCEVKITGTPEHPDDLYEWIATGTTETGEKVSDFFKIIRVRALAPIGESHYYTNTDNMATESELPAEQLKALCPQMMTLKGLLMRSRLSQSTFIRKYQCRHSASSDRMFQVGRLMACKDPELSVASAYDRYTREYRMTVMGIDIATGHGMSFYAMCLLGIDLDFRHVIINLYRERVRFAQSLAGIMKWYRAYVPGYVFVESNGQQNAIIDAYKNVRLVDGIDVSGIERVPFEPVFTQNAMVIATTTGLSAMVDNGGIVFPDGDQEARDTMEPLIKEMKNYPSSSVKDCLMALLVAEAGYATKIGSLEQSGPIKGMPAIKGSYRQRVRGRRQTRWKQRKDVAQPAKVDAFGLKKGAGTVGSLIDYARRNSQ